MDGRCHAAHQERRKVACRPLRGPNASRFFPRHADVYGTHDATRARAPLPRHPARSPPLRPQLTRSTSRVTRDSGSRCTPNTAAGPRVPVTWAWRADKARGTKRSRARRHRACRREARGSRASSRAARPEPLARQPSTILTSKHRSCCRAFTPPEKEGRLVGRFTWGGEKIHLVSDN